MRRSRACSARLASVGAGLNKVFLPGYDPARTVRLMREAIQRCELDLRGSVVLTEAAIGAYAVTPILAAMAGADRVYAVTRKTRYGSVADVMAETQELAKRAGIEERVRIVVEKTPDTLAQADIVTNSGHVRPIDRILVGQLKPTAVVPLMYESWEYRSTDVDIAACRRNGIAVAGTNERHKAVDVFSYLGIMAVKLLLDAGVAVYRSRVLLLCDNPFAPFIENGLSATGAVVTHVTCLSHARDEDIYDAIVVALVPTSTPSLEHADANRIKRSWNGAVVAQFWGDIRRDAFMEHDVPLWPAQPPGPGHMGILPSEVGPEPVIRLQSGGLKVGEVMWRARKSGLNPNQAVQVAIQSGYADGLAVLASNSK
jgi:hypothetical protein